MNEGTLLMIGMNRNQNDLESVITYSNEQNTGIKISHLIYLDKDLKNMIYFSLLGPGGLTKAGVSNFF